MKNEVAKYNARAKEIPPLTARQVKDKNDKKVDNFDIKQWWLEAKVEIPSCFRPLRAVLTHAVLTLAWCICKLHENINSTAV